jgi:uncharacterized protein
MKTHSRARWVAPLRRTLHRSYQAAFWPLGGPSLWARRQLQNLHVTHHHLVFPDLPIGFEGLTITHLSDLHLDATFPPEFCLPVILRICQELGSELICVTGDWTDEDPSYLERALPFFATVKPPLGWVGVLGNHDAHRSRRLTIKLLRSWLGERLLINEVLRLSSGSSVLDILGLDDVYPRRRLARALVSLHARRSEAAPFTLALLHDPGAYGRLCASQRVDLALAGHTHGGQISWTRAPQPAWGPVTHLFPYCRGLYRKDSRQLYVSCGLGATVPLRINCPPEIAHFRLTRG